MEVTDLLMMASSGGLCLAPEVGAGAATSARCSTSCASRGLQGDVCEEGVCACGRVGEPGCRLSWNRPGSLPAGPGPCLLGGEAAPSASPLPEARTAGPCSDAW